MTDEQIIAHLYTNFNNRDIDAVLLYFHPEVAWPNGWEGGYVHGHDAVRDYWTRQWKEIDPIVEPINLHKLGDGKIAVNVQQVVKDLAGNLMAEVTVKHTYSFDNGLVRRMDIEA